MKKKKKRWFCAPAKPFILLLAMLFLPLASVFARCGAIDYAAGPDVLLDTYTALVTFAIGAFYIAEAIGGILCIVGAFQIYVKMNLGEDGVKKDILILVGACIFLISAFIVVPSFFGFQVWVSSPRPI